MKALLAVADDVGRLLDDAKRQASGELTAVAVAELPFAIDRLVLQRYRRMWLLVVLVGLVACAVCGGAGYWLAGRGPALQCADQPNGGRVCWTWVRPPTKF
ncbi:MAG: hypothetical protein NVS1B6_14990 [Steroidobacteraceae bacterium]